LFRDLVAAVCAVPVASAAAPLTLTGKRCDVKFKLTGNPSRPGTLPGGDASRIKSAWDTYDYVNQRQSMDGLAAPTAEDLEKAGTDSTKWKEGDPRKVFASCRQSGSNRS
jgi:hypothetical protein